VGTGCIEAGTYSTLLNLTLLNSTIPNSTQKSEEVVSIEIIDKRSFIEDDEIKIKLKDFEEMRKSIKKPMTEKSR
jgi:hypothetical protein